jgi:hypothetical protein
MQDDSNNDESFFKVSKLGFSLTQIIITTVLMCYSMPRFLDASAIHSEYKVYGVFMLIFLGYSLAQSGTRFFIYLKKYLLETIEKYHVK